MGYRFLEVELGSMYKCLSSRVVSSGLLGYMHDRMGNIVCRVLRVHVRSEGMPCLRKPLVA